MDWQMFRSSLQAAPMEWLPPPTRRRNKDPRERESALRCLVPDVLIPTLIQSLGAAAKLIRSSPNLLRPREQL